MLARKEAINTSRYAEALPFIREHLSTNPGRVLAEKLSNGTRIIAMGECHSSSGTPLFAAGLIPLLRETGLTHLAIEIPSEYQHLLDYGSLWLWRNVPDAYRRWKCIIDSAQEAGLNVIFFDTRKENGEKWLFDEEMAELVCARLRGATNPKILLYGGAWHMARECVLERDGKTYLLPCATLAKHMSALADSRLFSLTLFSEIYFRRPSRPIYPSAFVRDVFRKVACGNDLPFLVESPVNVVVGPETRHEFFLKETSTYDGFAFVPDCEGIERDARRRLGLLRRDANC